MVGIPGQGGVGRRGRLQGEEASRRIVELLGDVPRIELFARQHAPGWDAWGDEIGEQNGMG